MVAEGYRLSYRECRDLLSQRVAEPAPGRIQLLSGPRQVGKTTLLLELASRLGKTSIYAAADGPEAALPGFWERLWTRAEQVAVAEGRAVVLLDEAGSSASRSPTGQPRRLRRSSASRRGRRPVHSCAWDLIRAPSAFGKT